MRGKTIFIIAVVIIFFSKCDNLVESQKAVEEIHASEYTWTIDTLEVDTVNTWFRARDFLYLDENDIYILGDNGYFCDVCWHYNGKEWKDTLVVSYARYITDAVNIDGELYSVGRTEWYLPEYSEGQGMVLKFNGKKWEPVFWASADNQRISEYWDIWADSEDNIWVGGWFGLLHHFNGREWEDYCLPDSIWITAFSGKNSDELCASAYSFDDQGYFAGYFLTWQDTAWVIEDQFKDYTGDYYNQPFGYNSVYVGEDFIYTCGRGVCRKRPGTNNWEKFCRDQDKWTHFFDIAGTSDNNLYAAGAGATIRYWDGDQWYCLAEYSGEYPQAIYNKVWTDGQQVYIIGYDYDVYDRIYVIHGK